MNFHFFYPRVFLLNGIYFVFLARCNFRLRKIKIFEIFFIYRAPIVIISIKLQTNFFCLWLAKKCKKRDCRIMNLFFCLVAFDFEFLFCSNECFLVFFALVKWSWYKINWEMRIKGLSHSLWLCKIVLLLAFD